MAKRLVASSTDPSTLILKLIGEDYVDSSIIEDVKRIEWGDSSQIHISPRLLQCFSKTSYERRSGIIPSNPLSILSNDSIIDSSRVPSQITGTSRQLIKILILSVPYDIKRFDTDSENHNRDPMIIRWSDFKEQYSNQIIDNITQLHSESKGYILKESVILSNRL